MLADPDEGIVGYQVITIDGVRMGVVAGLSASAILVRLGLWPFGRTVGLPPELAVVRDIDRSVIALVDSEDLKRVRRPRRRGTPASTRSATGEPTSGDESE